jgi:hypothetical protein
MEENAMKRAIPIALVAALLAAPATASAVSPREGLVEHPVSMCLSRSGENASLIEGTVRPAGCISGCATLEHSNVGIEVDEEYRHIVVTAIYELGSNGQEICPAVCMPLGGDKLSVALDDRSYALIINNEYRGRVEFPLDGSDEPVCSNSTGRKAAKLPGE